jgi:hypothetical protein
MDDNVHVQNTLQLVGALQRADKDFEVMLYPQSRHGIGAKHYQRLVVEFMKRTLKPDPGEPTIKLNARRTEACITVPTALQPSFEIAVVASPAGRSLLSDDLMLIDAVASSVGRRIDEIRIEHDRIAREQWEREIHSLATESELRALRAQLNRISYLTR